MPFVLGGSIRDDGPLPDTMTDVVDAADRMRELVGGVGVALMLATTLHAIATGNILPAGVETFCVDINQAVVTKLADRGSHQAHGIVTDAGLFVGQLADELDAVSARSATRNAAQSARRSSTTGESQIGEAGPSSERPRSNQRSRQNSLPSGSWRTTMLPSGPPSGRITVAPRPTKAGHLGVGVVGPQVDVDPVLHALASGTCWNQDAVGVRRALHQHGRVVLDVVDAHAPEPLELGVVVRRRPRSRRGPGPRTGRATPGARSRRRCR